MEKHTLFCCTAEPDYTNDARWKELFQNGVTHEAITQSCRYRSQLEQNPVLTLPSELELMRMMGIPSLYDLKHAVEWILNCPMQALEESIKHQKNSPLLFQVSGAFSILAEALGSEFLFRALRKSQGELQEAIIQINEWTALRIEKATKLGVRLISFADPCAMMELIGEKAVKDFSVLPTLALLEIVEPTLHGACLHLCPRLSYVLTTERFCTEEIFLCRENNLSLSLLSMAKNEEVTFTGQICMHASACKSISVLKLRKQNEG